MKRYILFLFVLVLVFGFGFSSAHAWNKVDCHILATLRIGSIGEQVSCLQTYLGGLTVDAKFGPMTANAVKAWQASKGLRVDGIFGAMSRAVFNADNGFADTGGSQPHGGCSSVVDNNVIAQMIKQGLVPDISTGMGCELSSNIPDGCYWTLGYSRTTGKPCSGTAYPRGCSVASGYSSIDGTPCTPSATDFTGCGSSTGYSPITGIACGGGTTSSAPVITGVSGSQSLSVGQVGTWTVSAYDKNGGNLSYSVVWGDEAGTAGAESSSSKQQTATFTHSYAKAGTYAPVFTVTNDIVCVKAPCPNSASTSLSVNVADATTPKITVLSPNGGEQWKAGETHDITWNYSGSSEKAIRLALYWHGNGGAGDAGITPNSVQASSQKYSWTIPSTVPKPGESYKIGLYDASTSVFLDQSDNDFYITSATTPTTVPAIPTNFTATPGSCGTNKINLSWTASTGATKYTLITGPLNDFDVVYSGSATSFSHPNLEEGLTYTYRVRAENSIGNSSYSTAITGTAPVACQTPVTSLTVSPTSSTASYSAGSLLSAFTVFSTESWTVSSNQTWLTPNKVSGKGNSFVGFSYTANTSPTTRTAIITIATGTKTATYTFKQSGKITNPTQPNTGGGVLGAEAFNFTQTLVKGSTGNEVLELQKYLNTAGYDCGNPDGIFGAKTLAAVIKFQTANGLEGDGVVGILTRVVLNS